MRGPMPAYAAWELARDRFRTLGGITEAAGICIGIESVPTKYGADFLTSWTDVLRMVQEVDSPGIGVHLDNACILLEGDSIAEAIVASKPKLVHFHAAQPELGDFRVPLPNHYEAARALKAVDYDGWISVEMLQHNGGDLAKVETAVQTVKNIYFDVTREQKNSESDTS